MQLSSGQVEEHLQVIFVLFRFQLKIHLSVLSWVPLLRESQPRLELELREELLLKIRLVFLLLVQEKEKLFRVEDGTEVLCQCILLW